MKLASSLICLLLLAFFVGAQERQEKRIALKPVFIDGKWGYADDSGKIVIQPQFDRARPFSEGLAAVAIATDPDARDLITGGSGNTIYSITVDRDDFLWGYVDETGRIVISLQFNDADDFSDGLASFMIGRNWWLGRWGYIDKTGAVIVPPQFSSHIAFADGRAWVSIGKLQGCDESKPDSKPGRYGYVDRSGNFTATTCEEWSAGKARANKSPQPPRPQ
jgi:hypothetical protein